jgi:putative solute:sodium symporter small subunit
MLQTGGVSLFGLPLAYWLALHGGVVLAVSAVAWFASVQERLDRWHGAHEEF